ncbi:substrate-binding domain-containing protein [Paraburkholderia acidisoli]|uniref:4,5-dihydroxyphthalate decarboxylase n=1 Tax=Paraburkholderia acidisoli TaxID=2571748 RepID=A0A7Z2GPG1_9BURK|nr:4,5-dihydroxyphthalate decarboxylase [Paraburkholderia acidisoli]QGZ65551.1 4,5-dihydroxyphthalate decarboxylase [Paraburkholderia acidisoli]
MNQLPLDIAFWNYDRVQPLIDGTVEIKNVSASFHTARIVTEIFKGMIAERQYDVAELGMTYLLRTIDQPNAEFVGIPVFLNRAFRHSAIYINKSKGIERPQDLAGKRIGELALYGHDSGIMSKGVLADEFGVQPASAQWLVGAIDFPMEPVDFVTHPHPANVQVEWASKEADLGTMLEEGELDALISADIPKCVLEGSPKVGRLFPNYVELEQAYFARTRVFPIMHTVAVRRTLAEERPDIVKAVYDAFCEAKASTMKNLAMGMTFNNMSLMVPWLTHRLEENRNTLGNDWWPYGIAGNRVALETILRYHYEQGITSRQLSVDEVFVPYLMDT